MKDLFPYIFAFFIGLSMVAMVSANTRLVVRGNALSSAVISYLISTVWSFGIVLVAHKGIGVGQAYAAGSAIGTCIGIRLSRQTKGEIEEHRN
jgi:hypothetical protein